MNLLQSVIAALTTPHICHYTTLWFIVNHIYIKINNINEILMLENKKNVINNKWQGSIATYVKCGGIVSIHITTNLLQWKK